jgi:hypothetical protein
MWRGVISLSADETFLGDNDRLEPSPPNPLSRLDG